MDNNRKVKKGDCRQELKAQAVQIKHQTINKTFLLKHESYRPANMITLLRIHQNIV